MKTFDDLLLAYTGRDAAYHERAQTTGLDFARHVYAAMSAAPVQLAPGLRKASLLLQSDCAAFVMSNESPAGSGALSTSDQDVADCYSEAMAFVASAEAEIERLSAELRRERDEAIASADHAIRLFDEMRNDRDRLAVRLARIEQARPVAWMRFLPSGGTNGPLRDDQVQAIHRASWTPLIAADWVDRSAPQPPSDHPEDDLEIGPVRQPSICTSAGNIGTGDLCTAYSETTGRCSHPAECDYQQRPARPEPDRERERELLAALHEIAECVLYNSEDMRELARAAIAKAEKGGAA
ncbi:hypothetical protein X805_23930 [Sphaerotilus natans subsp. natans DSM 6575]|uniref:Uncharacterized protein n=1 Tax=Sphaerotilus natans subsp. natans DSM 6575 TaxID=1286631 RepID=A0A059KLS1_9BURK|nr:hypothetical protein [Sphaerotilus natans]KDB52023.1 hypothetical protein X805_23930 [Sphaerotilus natans subsp. natans DSM 6575]SIQ08991.1 hypothetical protein SAMN05421778_101326 [Sphaerotilus natans]